MNIEISDNVLSDIIRNVFSNDNFDVKVKLGSNPNCLIIEVTETTRDKNIQCDLNDELYIYDNAIRKLSDLLYNAKDFLVYRYARRKACGEGYIITTDKKVAEKNGMRYLYVDGEYSYVVLPENGHVYDFRGATSPVWMCGKPYTMNASGECSPIDVQGKRIEIIDVCIDDDTNSATVIFIIV